MKYFVPKEKERKIYREREKKARPLFIAEGDG